MLKNIELEHAIEILLSKIETKDTEKIGLLESIGRILATDVFANINVPGFNRSPLDGYAVVAKNTEGASYDNPVELEVIGESAAGQAFKGEFKENTAVRIMTGAMIPEGYDTIIKKEDTDDGIEIAKIYVGSKAYDNFARSGEDVKIGEKIISKGSKINPGLIGMCAALGMDKLEVFKKPKIGVVSTGTELKDITEELEDGKIYNSNLYSIVSSLIQNNCIPVNLGIAEDTIEGISGVLKENIDECDLIISTGGASVGDYDLINKVYEHLGAKTLFWRLKMKPGTPALAADYDGKLLIGLSGNPGAALITFETIVRPVLRKLIGVSTLDRKKAIGFMMDDFNKTSGQRRFTRVRAEINGERIEVSLSGKQNPGVLKSMISCNALIDIAPNSKPLKKGDRVEIMLLDENEIGL